jgi:hypothetical protein
MAAYIGRLLQSTADLAGDNLQVVYSAAEAVNRFNTPPLPDCELRRTFDSILRRERAKRSATPTRDEAGRLEGWKLKVIDSDPPVFHLWGEFWLDDVRLTAAEMRSPAAIGRAVLAQRGGWLPPEFNGLWRGTKKAPSIAAELLANAEHEAPPSEWVAAEVVEELVLDTLGALAPWRSGEPPPVTLARLPAWEKDGTLVFLFEPLLAAINKSRDEKVTRYELTQALKGLGVATKTLGSRDDARKVKVLPKDQTKRLGNARGTIEV